MPLSEHEQKMLQQMEQALYAEDPHFANRLQHTTSATRRRVLVGAIGILCGLGMVIGGVMNAWVVLGGLGFVVMVVGAVYALTPVRTPALRSVDGPSAAPPSRPGAGRSARSAGFMSRLEQRWDRRRHED